MILLVAAPRSRERSARVVTCRTLTYRPLRQGTARQSEANMGSDEITFAQPSHVAPAGFVIGGTPSGEIEVRISYGMIDRFSEGLYSSPNKSFEELVSNSYDAGAEFGCECRRT